MSEHFDHDLQAARRMAARYVLDHSGVEIVIANDEPIPDETLCTMLGVMGHEPLQPIGRHYRPLDIDAAGRPTKYDLNDKTILVELIGRSQLIFLAVVHSRRPQLLLDRHDNTRNGIARWAALRLDRLAPLQWWLRRHPRTPAEVQAFYAVREELGKLAARHWSSWWYGRTFLEDRSNHGQ